MTKRSPVLQARFLLAGFLLALAFFVLPSTVWAADSPGEDGGTPGEIITMEAADPVCAIGEDQYATLDEALSAINEGEEKTIRLLKDIDYNGGIVIENKTVTFDLNGHTLNIINDAGNALEVGENGVMDLFGAGSHNVECNSSNNYAVFAVYGGKATVTSASGSCPYAVYAEGSGSFVHVTGNVETTHHNGQGVYAHLEAEVQVDGNVTGVGYGVFQSYNSTILVKGNVSAATCGVQCGTGSVTVEGSVTVTNSNACGVTSIYGDSYVRVMGDVTAFGNDSAGVKAVFGGTATIEGNVTANDEGSLGATVRDSGTIIINGILSAPRYIEVEADIKSPSDFEPGTGSHAHYKVYTDGDNTVLVKNKPPVARSSVPTQQVAINHPVTFTAYDIAENADNDALAITSILTLPNPGTAVAELVYGDITVTGIAVGSSFLEVTVSDTIDTVIVTVPIAVTPDPATTFTVTFNSQGGSAVASLTGISYGSTIAAPPAPTRPGYSFGGWYKEPACLNSWNFSVDTVTGNITLYAKWIPTGGGGGDDTGSGGGGGGNGGDGTVTGVPVTPAYTAYLSGTGTGDITLPVQPAPNASSATTELNTALAKDVFAASGPTVLTVPVIPGVSSYTLGLPAECLSNPEKPGSLTFSTPAGSITIPAGMLAGTPEGTGKKQAAITISLADKSVLPPDVQAAVGDRPLIRLTLTLDGVQSNWNNPAAPVTVSVPYTPTPEELADPEHIVVWYMDGSGNVIPVPSGRYDPATGTVTFTVTHFSYYAVAYVHKTFNDLGNAGWARKPIEVLASKGIINGITQDTFSPAANITRADFLVLLVRTLGLAGEIEDSFEDVLPGTYYYEAAGIAKRLGIATGRGNNRFHPGESISRQDMMVLTARALARCRGWQLTDDQSILDRFTDKEDMASYAGSSIATLVKEGLVEGSNNKLNPRAYTTRAEAAVFLYRLYNN